MDTPTFKLVSPQSRSAPDAVAVMLTEATTELPGALDGLGPAVCDAVAGALGRAETGLGRGKGVVLYPGEGDRRVLLLGLGPAEGLDAEAVRIAAARAQRLARPAEVNRLALHAPQAVERLGAAATGRALAEGLAIAAFDFTAFQGAATAGDGPQGRGSMAVSVDRPLRTGFERGQAAARGITTARRLAATPPNTANPAYIAKACRTLARDTGLRCTVIGADRAQKLGMGGLTAVGRAGSTPPALIVLEHRPEPRSKGRSTRKPKRPVLLVGKAITFDTGGYSLKVGGSMKKMKYDKCGGMAVIGAMEAVARLGLDQPVVGLIPCAENMIDQTAYRVDDILTFCNGVTAEVTNTDAEGRLVLADALAYGTRTYDPEAVIDLATLTGGVVVALGSFCAGLFCNEAGLRDRLLAAGRDAGERLWELPLWDEHREMMKGQHADLVNSGARKAHPIQGAAFLSFFVGADAPTRMPTLPWAHLDIAGVADAEEETALFPVGPTGFGVRLLTRLLEGWGKDPA